MSSSHIWFSQFLQGVSQWMIEKFFLLSLARSILGSCPDHVWILSGSFHVWFGYNYDFKELPDELQTWSSCSQYLSDIPLHNVKLHHQLKMEAKIKFNWFSSKNTFSIFFDSSFSWSFKNTLLQTSDTLVKQCRKSITKYPSISQLLPQVLCLRMLPIQRNKEKLFYPTLWNTLWSWQRFKVELMFM